MTRNFAPTLKAKSEEKLDVWYMRPVDTVVLFDQENPEALLLSEREADDLLPIIWNVRSSAKAPPRWRLVNLCYVLDNAAALSSVPLILPPPSEPEPEPELGPMDALLTTINLFNGGTAFAAEASKKALAHLLCDSAKRAAALLPAQMRGKQRMISRSDLEVASTASDHDGAEQQRLAEEEVCEEEV